MTKHRGRSPHWWANNDKRIEGEKESFLPKLKDGDCRFLYYPPDAPANTSNKYKRVICSEFVVQITNKLHSYCVACNRKGEVLDG